MNEKKKEPPSSLFNFLVTVSIIGGVALMYYIVFTKPDNEIVMNQYGDLEHRDNSFILPIQKLAMIVLPIVGLYYLIIKSRIKK